MERWTLKEGKLYFSIPGRDTEVKIEDFKPLHESLSAKYLELKRYAKDNRIVVVGNYTYTTVSRLGFAYKAAYENLTRGILRDVYELKLYSLNVPRRHIADYKIVRRLTPAIEKFIEELDVQLERAKSGKNMIHMPTLPAVH